MNLKNITLNTLIPQWPGILNFNNQEFQRSLNVFYNETGNIIIAPVNTPGNVKAASGQFVNVVVDNLTVKNQFTNLYDNNTTADFNFYKLYIDPAVQPRDPCTAITWWPQESNGKKYVDVNKPYYKIQNITQPYVFNNNNLSQVVGIFLDPSLVSPTNQFQVLLDPVGKTYFTADASAAGDPSMGTGFYVELIAVSYDPSYGTTWAQYKYGLPVVGTGGGGSGSGNGTVGPGTTNAIAMFTGPTTVTDSPLSIVDTNLNTFGINADGIITLTNKKITGVATPTDSSDAVNKLYADSFFVTNTSVNTTFAQFIRSASTGTGLTWVGGVLNVSASATGASLDYVDGSLAKRDASITNLYAIKANNASLGLYATILSLEAYATDVSINTAGFAKNASLGLYATNASIGLALQSFATNASINTAAFAKKIYVDGSLAARDASISWLATNTLTIIALNPYATNASVGLALEAYTTNASISTAGFATNVSVNTALGVYVTNSSANIALTQFIKSSSTGFGLIWNGGLLDVSMAGINDAATNASLYYELGIRDISIAFIATNYIQNSALASFLAPYILITDVPDTIQPYIDTLNSSVNNAFSSYYTSSYIDDNFITQAYVDGSLALQQLQINSLDNRITTLESSTGNVNFIYVDGSLLARDASITDLYNKIFISDTSVLTLALDLSILDASLYALTVASSDFATNASINAIDFAKNSSVNYLYGWQLTQDATISLIIGANATQQSQITTLQNQNAIQDGSIIRIDSSINWLMAQTSGEITTTYFHDYVDSSLIARDLAIADLAFSAATYDYVDNAFGERDASILWLQNNALTSTALNPYATNASVGIALSTYVKSASTRTGLFWVGGYLDVSILSGDVTKAYVDSSISVFATNASVNIQINQLDASIIAINASLNNTVDIDMFSTFLLNASLGTDFAWNAGVLDVSVGAGVTSLIALTDVSITSIVDKSLLQYDSSTAKWKNVSPLDASIYFQRKLTQSTPGSSTATGNAGDWSYDASYLYICANTNTWGRVVLSAF